MRSLLSTAIILASSALGSPGALDEHERKFHATRNMAL